MDDEPTAAAEAARKSRRLRPQLLPHFKGHLPVFIAASVKKPPSS
jgi:hypothetical protein